MQLAGENIRIKGTLIFGGPRCVILFFLYVKSNTTTSSYCPYYDEYSIYHTNYYVGLLFSIDMEPNRGDLGAVCCWSCGGGWGRRMGDSGMGK